MSAFGRALLASAGTLCLRLLVRQRIRIEQPTNHLLVLGMMLLRLMLEELDASLLKAIVTFTVSSLNTSSSGVGRKSGTTLPARQARQCI